MADEIKWSNKLNPQKWVEEPQIIFNLFRTPEGDWTWTCSFDRDLQVKTSEALEYINFKKALAQIDYFKALLPSFLVKLPEKEELTNEPV
jgi:hypothetical protein